MAHGAAESQTVRYANDYATGAGTERVPYQSASGCAGILEAFTALPNSGGTLYLRKGRYKITRPGGCVLRNKDFRWNGEGAAETIIDASGLPLHATAITVSGELSDVGTTADRVAAGLTEIRAATAGLVAGDWVMLHSKTELWNTARKYYFKGEWQQIESMKHDSLKTREPLWDTYAAGALVSRMRPVQVDISGFEIRGNPDLNSGMNCMVLSYAVRSSIHETTTRNCNERGWGMYYTIDSSFHNNQGSEIYPKAPIGLNYGLMVVMSYRMSVFHNTLRAGRHAVALGCGELGGVNRRIVVSENDLSGGDAERVLDAHGVAEYYQFEKNRIDGGIVAGGQFGTISGNIIYPSAYRRHAIMLAEVKSWNFDIVDNQFPWTLTFAPVSFIRINPEPAAEPGTIKIKGNHFQITSGRTPDGLQLKVASGWSGTIEYANNTVKDAQGEREFRLLRTDEKEKR